MDEVDIRMCGMVFVGVLEEIRFVLDELRADGVGMWSSYGEGQDARKSNPIHTLSRYLRSECD